MQRVNMDISVLQIQSVPIILMLRTHILRYRSDRLRSAQNLTGMAVSVWREVENR